MGWWGWVGVGWDGVKWGGWDGMGWAGMGWDGMGWDGMGWNGMEWDGMGWDGMAGDSGVRQRHHVGLQSKLPLQNTKKLIVNVLTFEKVSMTAERRCSEVMFSGSPTFVASPVARPGLKTVRSAPHGGTPPFSHVMSK